MELGLFNNVTVEARQNEATRSFVKELEGALENRNKPRKQVYEEPEIFEKIKDKKNISIVARNEIREKIDKVISRYIKDKENVKDEISKIIADVLVKQDKMLKEYREEGHLYIVEENINDRIYLADITKPKGYSIEEIEFPDTLRYKAAEGTLFKFEKGTYQFYSDKGFEMLYKKE